jgi:HK97 family phage prohead protease
VSELIEVRFEEAILRFDDNSDGRTLTGYAVPWDKPAPVLRPVPGYEVYKRGALTKSVKDGRVIPLLGLHREEGPVGKLVDSYDDDFGQHVTFRLFDSSAARDAAELVREGVWTGLSIGAYAIPARTRVYKDGGRQIVERSEVKLDHVALVRTPAFVDAQVLALRQEDHMRDVAAVAAARKRRRARMT